ncbi:hypothetical protein EKH80_01620 [Dyella choica]|uniref:GIY-YIG domain-containing protein n=2 Tax=Dyella choica TaxID=1927959 RepID=A0A3S0SD12_9GAMM|nr:hypothetical protein EKH80_01620 [Dyella choica]
MKSSRAAKDFVKYKSVTRELFGKVGRTKDFPGCYVFLDNGTPVYVGISRSVVKRLVQHLNSSSHFTASLAYKMASDELPHEMTRDEAMKDDKFSKLFCSAKERLQSMSVAYIEIENDLELYIFEVYASMRLDTSKWNTFRTH